MTHDEAMAKATACYDQIMADAMANAIESLHQHGHPTQIEVEEFTAWYEQLLASDRATTLARLRAWLMRDGEPLM